MRFASYRRNGIDAVGLIEGDRILDLSPLHPTMQDVIEAGEGGLEAVRRQRAGATSDWLNLEDVQLTAPLPRPRRCLFCVGLNYEDHFKEGDAFRQGISSLPEYPAFFSKATGTVIGPDEPIGWPGHLSEQLDYEAELAVVIGKAGRDVPVEQAESHIFGYTLANDVSVRDIQRRHGGQWNKGKSFDRTCPMGPVVITPDELDRAQHIQGEVNGDVRQDCSLELMVFPVDQLIASLSEGMTIRPGDILLTGTPAGVGYARTPPAFLRPGDEVVVRLNGIGELRNIVGEDLSPPPIT